MARSPLARGGDATGVGAEVGGLPAQCPLDPVDEPGVAAIEDGLEGRVAISEALHDAAARETDEAAAAAWGSRMEAMRDGCRAAIEALEADGDLADDICSVQAIDMLQALLGVPMFETLTLERGWTTEAYVLGVQRMAERAFLRGGPGRA